MLETLDRVHEGPLDDAEKEAIRFAEKVTIAHRELGPEDIDRLREHWRPEQIVELMVVCGLFNYLNRFSIAFGLTPTQPGEGGPDSREGAERE